MPLELKHTLHPNFLEITIRGERFPGQELEETIEIWSEIFKVSRLKNRFNILAHIRSQGRFPVKAQINLSFKIKEIGCTPEHRIAVISYSNEISKNIQLIIRFMNGKGYTIQLFKNKDKARRWLLKEKRKNFLKDLFDSIK